MKNHTFSENEKLPEDFEEYLDSLPKQFPNGWALFSENELLEKVNFDGEMVKRCFLPKAFAHFHVKNGIKKTRGKELSAEYLSQMFAIGSLNGDYLFLDKNYVWIYFHDGHELKVGFSWTQFLDKCVTVKKGSITPDLVGKWHPVSSETVSDVMFKFMCPSLELKSSGEAIKIAGENESTSAWKTKGKKIFIKAVNMYLEYNYVLEDDKLDIRSIDGDYHCHYVKK